MKNQQDIKSSGKDDLKQPLAERAAKAIFEDIDSGRWRAKLPGIRKLEKVLGVSNMTIRNALRILEKSGNIAPSEPGKKRAILLGSNAETPKKRIGLKSATIRMLHAKRLSLLEHGDQKAYHSLHDALGNAGASVHWVCEPSCYNTGSPKAVLEKMLKEKPADFWVVFAPTEQIAQWFAEQKIPRLFYGGGQKAHGPDAGILLEAKIEPVLEHLVALGHRRIVMPISEIWHKHAQHETIFEQRIRASFERYGIKATRYHMPRFSDHLSSLTEVLNSAFALTPPTALVAMDFHYYHTFACYCAEKKLSVPGHISLAAISHDNSIDWLTPTPTYMQPPSKSLDAAIVSRIRHLLKIGDIEDRSEIRAKMKLVHGASSGRVFGG